MAADFDATFAALREILRPYAKTCIVVHDTPENYYLDTKSTAPNGKPLMFAAVRKGKSYVSFYLFPVYMFPELLHGLSPALKKRMQGKSCFNFKAVEEEQLAELRELTARGVRMVRERYVTAPTAANPAASADRPRRARRTHWRSR